MRLWYELLDSATDEKGVVDIAQDYVASLTPSDLVNVPENCRPGRIRDHSDIDHWNLKLAEEVRALWGTDRDGQRLTEMSQFFLHASLRLSRINERLEVQPRAA